MGTDGLLTIVLGEGANYRVLPRITGFFGIISALFKRLWDQAEMHETLETDDNFEIVASTIKAIYDQTCRSCGLINRLIIYMPSDGETVRKMRIDHRVGDTPAKQKLLRPDKRHSEDHGPVSEKRQKDETASSRQQWDDSSWWQSSDWTSRRVPGAGISRACGREHGASGEVKHICTGGSANLLATMYSFSSSPENDHSLASPVSKARCPAHVSFPCDCPAVICASKGTF